MESGCFPLYISRLFLCPMSFAMSVVFLKQVSAISAWNRDSQGVGHSTEMVIDHHLFRIGRLLQYLPIRLAQVVFELDGAAIQLYIDSGRDADHKMRAMKVLGRGIIGLAPQQERAYLLHS